MRSYIPSGHKAVPENSELVFKGVIFDVYQWQQEMFDGSFATFERLKRPDTVEVICVVEDKILISQERQPDTEEFLTIPGGRHDYEKENELDAAKREVREELGHAFKNWKLIHAKQYTGKIDHILYTFLATEVEEVGEQQLDAGEEITVLEYSWEEFKALKHNPKMMQFNADLLDSLESMNDLENLPPLHQY